MLQWSGLFSSSRSRMQLLVVSAITLSIQGFGASVDAMKCYEKRYSLGQETETVCGEGQNICNIELDKNGAGQTRVVARGCGRKTSGIAAALYYGDNGYQPGCWKRKSSRPGSPDEVTCFCEGDLCNGENYLVVLTGLFADTLNNKKPLLSPPSGPKAAATADTTVVPPVTPAAVFEDNDPRLHQFIGVFIQRTDDAWEAEYDNPQQVLANIKAEVDKIADQAVKNAAARMNYPCNDGCTGKVLRMTELYGRFGRHILRVSVIPENLGSGYPDATVLNEIRKEVETLVNALSQPIAVLSASEQPTIATDPERVYLKDIKGRPTIYDIRNSEKDLLKPWVDLNPNCRPVGHVEYGLQVNMLFAESRYSITDGSRVTRIHYTVKSKSPFTKYPLPKNVNIIIPSRHLKSIVTVQPAVEIQVTTSTSTRVGTISTMYCFLKNNKTFIPYFTKTAPVKDTAAAVVIAAPPVPVQPVSAARNPRSPSPEVSAESEMTYGAPKCTDCQCGIPAHKILLKGHVSPEEVSNVTQLIGQMWRDTYDDALEFMFIAEQNELETYSVGTPDYDYRDPVYGNLTFLKYVVLVANEITQELLVPDIREKTLTDLLINSSYPPCIDCHPTTDNYAYVGGLTGSESRDAVVKALADSWNMDNAEVVSVTPSAAFFVATNYRVSGGWDAKIGNVALPVQRLDYSVAVPNGTSWDMLDYPDMPRLETFNSRFRTELGPNVTVYPFENVEASKL